MEFQTELKKELNQTRLKISLSGLYTEDYQIRMLRENRVQGMLPISARGEGETTVYEYDITGMISLRQYYKQKKISGMEMNGYLKQIQEAVEETERFLLNPNRLLLDPDYIFCEDGICRFCYFPQGKEDIRMSFHRLMDDFVQWTDYQDISSVKTAFYLHKETMKENYSLKRLIQELEKLERDEEEKKENNENREDDAFRDERRKQRREGESGRKQLWERETFEYDSEEHDWITRQEMGSKILKETDNLWSPVKRLLHRYKRPKWGDWDGVYIDEEDF